MLKSLVLGMVLVSSIGACAGTRVESTPIVTVWQGRRVVFVRGGSFDASNDSSTLDRIGDLWVDEVEVTRESFLDWVREVGEELEDVHPVNFEEPSRCPAIVSWEQADSYSRYHGMRLPTLSENLWFRSERGAHRLYPWGESNLPPQGMANIAVDEPESDPSGSLESTGGNRDSHVGYAPVGSYRPNTLGLFDVVGNAWEWTGTKDSMVEAESTSGGVVMKIMRPAMHVTGGSFNSPLKHLRLASRHVMAMGPTGAAGFRCVKDASKE